MTQHENYGILKEVDQDVVKTSITYCQNALNQTGTLQRLKEHVCAFQCVSASLLLFHLCYIEGRRFFLTCFNVEINEFIFYFFYLIFNIEIEFIEIVRKFQACSSRRS